MPTLGRKVRIGLEWTWSMCFASDITHLRFTRSPELGDAEPADIPAQPAPR
jgi:NADH dehydrogenase